MSMKIDGNSLVTVKAIVKRGTDSITNTTVIEMPLKDAVSLALKSVPNQAASTATVADLVAALATIPN